MTIFDQVVSALRQVTGDDVTLTVAGKQGQGNQNARVHYKGDNLLTKVLYRHDLSRLGVESEEVKMYLAGLHAPQQAPWTIVPGREMVELTAVLRAAGIDADMFLPESTSAAMAVLNAYQGFNRTNAFIRQWTARGKGVGLEVIVVFKEGDEFAIFETSLNFYIQPNADKLVNQLKELQAKRNAEVVGA